MKLCPNAIKSVANILNTAMIKRETLQVSAILRLFCAPKYLEINIVLATLVTFNTIITIFII